MKNEIKNEISLIISTYNWSEALYLVLKSVAMQSCLPHEVIIADDGSGDKTKVMIENAQAYFAVPLIHAWQADEGFRLARSRNNAVSQATGNYLVFIDGDMILHRNFIKDHSRLARRNHFTVGSRVLLRKSATLKIFQKAEFDFSLLKLPRAQADNKLNALYFPLLARIYASPVREPIEKWVFKVRGCNMGVWRSDYNAVNGFNNDFNGWGREDSEFSLRLFKKGLSMRRLKFSAIQYHLYHQENDRSCLNINDETLQETFHSEGFLCRNGLSKL